MHRWFFFILLALASAFSTYTFVQWREGAYRDLTAKEAVWNEAIMGNYVRPRRVPFPRGNPYSKAKHNLGKQLFFDPILSGHNDMSCATCHDPNQHWTDGNKTAIGFNHKVLSRRTPTLLNSAFQGAYFWDRRASTLEQQALGPITAADEMNQDMDELVQELLSIKQYREAFAESFPEAKPSISAETISQAIATFERSIVSKNTPFDRWISGESEAISVSAKRGFHLFNTKAKCSNCHSGWNFTNSGLFDTGMSDDDLGFNLEGKPHFQHMFKPPTLREVANRAPYMHNGSMNNLEEVIEFYNVGGHAKRVSNSSFTEPLNLTKQEKKDLVHFLQTLSSDEIEVATQLQ